MCDELAKSHENISVIHQKNGGVSAARNTGINAVFSITEGYRPDDNSYIAFLDADDFWHPGTINFDPAACTADIVGFSTMYCNTRANRFLLAYEYTAKEITAPVCGTVDWIFGGHLGAHLYRTQFLKESDLHFIEGCKYNEDIIFIRQAVFCASSFKFAPEILYIYRRNTSSAVHNLKNEIDDTLMIPRYWASVTDWSFQYDEIPEQNKLAWKHSCETYVGGRVLEALGTLIELGYDYNDIMTEIKKDDLLKYLDMIQTKDLSDWQKPDLDLLRNNQDQFIETHKSAGRSKKIQQRLLKTLPFLTAVYDRKRYPLDKLI